MAFKATSNHNHGTSKKSYGRRVKGYGRNHSARTVTRHPGVGVRGNRQCNPPKLIKDYFSILAWSDSEGIVKKQAYDWDTAMALEHNRRAQVWAKRTILRAANRAAFTLEAIYNLLGYKPSLTVGKQAVVKTCQEFKSVGAAAYVAPQTQQNKVNNGGTQPQEVTVSADHSALFQMVNIAVQAGGTAACFAQMDKTKSTTGKLIACYSFINASGVDVVSNWYPVDDINPFSKKIESYAKPEATVGKSRSRGFGYVAAFSKEDIAAEFGQVVAPAVRVLGSFYKKDPQYGEIASLSTWGNAAYMPHNLFAKNEAGEMIPVGNRDVHVVFNLPGREVWGWTGTPGSNITNVRKYMRDMMFKGDAGRRNLDVDKFKASNPNFDITVNKSLNDCVAGGEGFFYKGDDTGIHIALVIAEVASTPDGHDDIELWKAPNSMYDMEGYEKVDNEGQVRIYVNKMAVVYMPVPVAMNFFKPTPDQNHYNAFNSGMWPKFAEHHKARYVQVNWQKLAEYTAKLPNPANPWSEFERYCLSNLGDIVVSNKPAIAETVIAEEPAPTPVVEVETVVKERTVKANTNSVASKVKDLLLIKEVANEVVAYDKAKQDALQGDPINDNFDVIDFVFNNGHLEFQPKLNAADFEKAYAKGALAVAAVAGKMTKVMNGGRVKCKGYHWEIKHLQMLLDTLYYASGGLVQVAGTEKNETYSIDEYIYLKDTSNGEHELWMGGVPAFRFTAERIVIDVTRGRIFHHTIEMAYLDKDAAKLNCFVADSFSNFMHFFVNGMMPLMGAYFDQALPSNFLANCLSFMSKMPSIEISSDKWEDENGARGMLMAHTYKPTIAYKTPFLQDGKIAPLAAGAKDLAAIHHEFEMMNVVAAPTATQPNKTEEKSLNDMNTSLMETIIGKYYLESHFTKACYLPFGAVNIGLLQIHCPNLFKHAQEVLGDKFNAKEVATVVILTLKATKGLKRLSLWMAKAARPVVPAAAGYVVRNQFLRTVGTAVNLMLAPSLVAPPGQNYLVNALKLIEAYVDKTETNYKVKSFKVDELTKHPFEFVVSSCADIRNASWTVEDRKDGYIAYVVPNGTVKVEGNKPLLFSIKTEDANAIDANMVYHERDYEGELQWIRYKIEQSLTRDDVNLVVEYQITWKEGNPKLRSFNKCQVVRCNPLLVRNKFNPSLEGIEFDMVCTQDALKLDVLYCMLMLIGNSVNAAYKAGNLAPKMVAMHDMIVAINSAMDSSTNPADPVLVIDEVAVVCGLYQDLLDYFEANFVHAEGIWFDWQRAETQARIVYNLYTNKVEAGKGWVREHKLWNKFPELKGLLIPAGSKVVCYREAGEITNKTNILVFVVDANGLPSRYLQRTYVIVGDAAAPLVNVELYESSTVQESVSTSNIRLPEIVGIDQAIADPELALAVQKEMLAGGRENMLRFAAIAYADAGAAVYGGLKDVHIKQYGGTLAFAVHQDGVDIWNALLAAGITIEDMANPVNTNFKQVCHALKGFNFIMPKNIVKNDGQAEEDWGYDADECPDEDWEPTAAPAGSDTFCLWMPALYSFTKLSSRNESNLDFVSKFYKEILKPLLHGQPTPAVNAKQCYSVMRSLLMSKDFIKLPSGKKNVTAKRIACGDVRPGEVHLLCDDAPYSAYQQARRVGFNMEAFLNEAVGHAARAPIANGYIAKAVLRRNVRFVDRDGNETVKQLIYRTGEAPVEAWYYLSNVQIATDVFLPTAFDNGDWDGDTMFFTLISTPGVKPNTWDDGCNLLNGASTLDLFHEDNDSYFGDHYGIKTYDAAMKTMGSGIVNAITHETKGTIISVKDHASNNADAILIQHGAVGIAYAVYMIGMIMTNLSSFLANKSSVKSLDKVMQVLVRPDAKNLIMVVCQMYEIMLGGPDKGPNKYRTMLLDDIVEGKRFESIEKPGDDEHNAIVKSNLDAVHTVMDSLGLKVAYYKEVAAIIEMTSIYYSIKKDYTFVDYTGWTDAAGNALGNDWFNLTSWIAIATFIFELGRGKFNGFKGVGRPDGSYNKKGKKKALAYQNCAATAFTFMDMVLGNIADDNVYLYALSDINATVGSIIKSTPAEITAIKWKLDDCMSFINACSDEVDDEPAPDTGNGVTSQDINPDDFIDDDDNGNYVKPSDDNDGDDDGGGAEVETIETEEVMTQEVKRGELHLVKRITRQMLKDNPNALFVFGDNFERRGMGGQAKEMRGEPNAVGIATKHKPSMSADAFLTDADYALAKDEFVNKIGFLKAELDAGKDIYFPEDGIGTGLSALADHSVCIWNYLTLCLRVNLGITKFLPVSEPVQETITADSTKESAEPTGAIDDVAQKDSEDDWEPDSNEEESDDDWGCFDYEEDEDEPAVAMSSLSPTPSVEEFLALSTEALNILQQLQPTYGETTINQLLQMVNSEQYNKVNKLDDIAKEVVPEMVEVKQNVIEAPRYYTGVGSRNTPTEVIEVMKGMAGKLSKASYTLRSGGAEGADQAFEQGCLDTGGKLDIYLPFNNFKGRTDSSHGCDPNGVAYMDATKLPNYAQAQQILKETLDPSHFSRLNGFALKAHTRNVYQVLGNDLNTPSEVLYCWTKDGAEVGGTATAIKLAKRYGVPVVNLGDSETLASIKAKLDNPSKEEVKPAEPTTAPNREGSVVKSEANQIKQEEQTLETVQAPARVAEETNNDAPAELSTNQVTKVQKLMTTLNEEQLVVVQTVATEHRNATLTGKGGAGKSYTVEVIRKAYNILDYPHIDVGSTGTSVVNISGDNTFNGMFGLGKGFEDDNYLNRTEEQWLEIVSKCMRSKQLMKRLPGIKAQMNKHKRPLLIIVDEVSMMDSLLLSAVEEALCKLMVPHHWLLVGDPMQFEPVNGHQFFKDVKVTAADGSVTIKKSIYNDPALNFCGFNLKNNMRAKGDKVWADALDAIRMHQVQDDLPEIVKERWAYSESNPAPADALVLTLTNKTVKRFNDAAARKLIKAGAHAKEYTGTVVTKIKEKDKSEGYWISNFEPISFKMVICKGMRVMLRETNLKDRNGDIEVNNGQTGTAIHLGDNYVRVKFDNGVSKDIRPIDMEDPQGRGTFTQLPLAPAYALTINKAQGMTFDKPVVFHIYSENKNNTVTPIGIDNALYVALSRLTTSENCYFETNVGSIEYETKKPLTPYNTLLKSYVTNKEALNFTYDLK